MSVQRWQDQLDRFLDSHSVAAVITSFDLLSTADIRLHLTNYRDQYLVGDVTQIRRRGIISQTDLENYGKPKPGDTIEYLDQRVTIDHADPRIEAGATIGYDLSLAGNDL